MTNQELNRDVKRLLKLAVSNKETYTADERIKTEISRLYHADREFISMSKTSALILLRLNLRYRAIPLHNFGLHIELETL